MKHLTVLCVVLAVGAVDVQAKYKWAEELSIGVQIQVSELRDPPLIHDPLAETVAVISRALPDISGLAQPAPKSIDSNTMRSYGVNVLYPTGQSPGQPGRRRTIV